MNSESTRLWLSYAFAFFLVGISIWFLWSALLDPNTAALQEADRGIVIGGMFTLMGSASAFVFGAAAASAAARQSERASAAGANAALSTPPAAPLPSPPDSVTAEPPIEGPPSG